MPLNREDVVEALKVLERKDPHCRLSVGVVGHEYKLNPTLSLEEVERFERKHGISLPEDYRDFILTIGNGGAGPHYGLFPLGEYTLGDERVPWREEENIGTLSEPFRYQEAWNLPNEFFDQEPDPPEGTPIEEEDRLMEAWHAIRDNQYDHPSIMNGAIPLCEIGCGLSQWLVVTGDQRGYVWNDQRADDAGISPMRNSDGEQMTFSAWYSDWLQKSKDAPNRLQAIWNASHALPEWLFVPTLCVVLAAGISTARLLGVRNKLAFLAISLACCFASVAVLSGFDKWLVARRNRPAAAKNQEEESHHESADAAEI